MWQEEVGKYHDEAYTLFNNALNNYMAHLQKIYNRGMIESWIEAGELGKRSIWSAEETLKHLKTLPYPQNVTETEIWIAGFNYTAEKQAPEMSQIFSSQTDLNSYRQGYAANRPAVRTP